MEAGEGAKGRKGRDERVYVCGGCQGIKRFYGMLRLSFSFLFFLRFWVSILLPLFSRALGTNFNFTDHAFGFALMVNLTPAADSEIMRSAVVGTTRDMLRPPIFMEPVRRVRFSTNDSFSCPDDDAGFTIPVILQGWSPSSD